MGPWVLLEDKKGGTGSVWNTSRGTRSGVMWAVEG